MAIGICSHWTNRLKDPPGRDAWLIELEPKYCDTAILRWEQYVGKDANLNGDGRPFAKVAQERISRAA